jgi:hypothetical protein
MATPDRQDGFSVRCRTQRERRSSPLPQRALEWSGEAFKGLAPYLDR